MSVRSLPPEPIARSEASVPGLVVRAHGLWYEVLLQAGDHQGDTVIATMRGALKSQKRRTDIVAVGDRVRVVELPDGEGAIEVVEPRMRVLARTARQTRDTDQVILANPDQVLFVFAIADPEPHLRMLDRFIVLAERQEVPVRIVVNKIELDLADTDASAESLFGMYRQLYPIHFVSARDGIGIDEVRAALVGKISAIAGPSGVGKSTLLNALDPEHRRETSNVSNATGKGRHTTVGARLYEIGPDTWVADTPGIRSLAMHAVPPEELADAFIEFRPFLGGCRYADCTHIHEPDCAIRAAVERGEIDPRRYQSYVMIRRGEA